MKGLRFLPTKAKINVFRSSGKFFIAPVYQVACGNEHGFYTWDTSLLQTF